MDHVIDHSRGKNRTEKRMAKAKPTTENSEFYEYSWSRLLPSLTRRQMSWCNVFFLNKNNRFPRANVLPRKMQWKRKKWWFIWCLVLTQLSCRDLIKKSHNYQWIQILSLKTLLRKILNTFLKNPVHSRSFGQCFIARHRGIEVSDSQVNNSQTKQQRIRKEQGEICWSKHYFCFGWPSQSSQDFWQGYKNFANCGKYMPHTPIPSEETTIPLYLRELPQDLQFNSTKFARQN